MKKYYLDGLNLDAFQFYVLVVELFFRTISK